MKIFYYCSTGVHAALVAGAIHIGNLPRDIAPDVKTICSLKNFANIRVKDIGKILFLGKTRKGNEIYTIGVKNEEELAPKAIYCLLKTFNINEEDFLLVNTFPAMNPIVRVGIKLKIQSLAAYGLRINYKRLLEIVVKTENNFEK